MSGEGIGPLQIREIVATMEQQGISELELAGPDVRLRLRRGGILAAIADVKAETKADRASAEISASAAGIFLRSHPLQDRTLVADGELVVGGQVIALLRIGPLVTPVHAPVCGQVVGSIAEDGTLVGYGTPLVGFVPTD